MWCYRRRCVKLTNGTQSDVAKDDDDENKTANHISAAPGEKKKCENKWDVWENQEEIKVIYDCWENT